MGGPWREPDRESESDGMNSSGKKRGGRSLGSGEEGGRAGRELNSKGQLAGATGGEFGRGEGGDSTDRVGKFW